MYEKRGPTPSPEEVRGLVRRIVDAALVGGDVPVTKPTEPSSPPVPPSPAAAPASATAVGGQGVVAIGGDHGGYLLKDAIGEWLRKNGFAVTDCGTHSSEAVDYPDIAHAVARHVADGTCRWGIVVDGAGIGSCMAANKVPGIRAALCHDISSARNSREHNHANVLTLGARFIGEGLAIEIVQTWLGTNWGYGRHEGRVNKITEIERRYARPANEVRA